MVRLSANKNDYWRISRTPAIGLLFVTPIWILYEVLAYSLNNGLHGDLRTGMDLLIKGYIQTLQLPLIFSIILPAGILVFIVFRHWPNLRRARPEPHHFAFMFFESLFYAVVFGLVVSRITGYFLTLSGMQWELTAVTSVVTRLGSGIYEEILFRLFLITGMISFLGRFLKLRMVPAYSIAILMSSIVFALFHYIDIFNEPLVLKTFLFRFVAGLVFSALFLLRGIGITVYTHSLYNILLFFRG